MSAHDQHLARYRAYVTVSYCTNRACNAYGASTVVDYQEEYGQGWIDPEDCPICGAPLTLDAPPEREESDADAQI